MTPTIALTLASLKMYFRNKPALFFSLILPFFIMAIFGIIDFGGFSEIRIGVVDKANTPTSVKLTDSLDNSKVIKLIQGEMPSQMRTLENGRLDLLVILPHGFGDRSVPTTIYGYSNQHRAQQALVGSTIIKQALDDLSFEATQSQRLYEFQVSGVDSNSTDYVDYLVPGIIAMSIMQMGLFGVTFAVIQFRQQGVLRRMRATPIHPGHFLAGQIITRLIVAIIQTLVLMGAARLIFDVSLRGNLGILLLLAALGGGLFISMGYAISGFTRNEETAAPITNIVSLPLMFLSGVFFTREHLPGFLQVITDFSPLTYLAEGMRKVTADGASLGDVSGDLIGLAIWLAVSFLIATQVFKWE